MKTIASVAIAGMLAASSLATSTTGAEAGPKRWGGPVHHHHYHHHDRSRGFNSGAALATGAILGLAIGAMATPSYVAPPPPVHYGPPPAPPRGYTYADSNYAQHVSWCSQRYRSYRADTNTWVGYDGYVRHCESPF